MTGTTPRPIDGHLPRQPATERHGMFERDELFAAERLRELRAAARDAHAAQPTLERFVDRARRSFGAGLIAIGTAVAGIRLSATEDVACEDCGVGAA